MPFTLEEIAPLDEVEEKRKRAKYYGHIHEASLVEMVYVVENMSAICWDEISNTQFVDSKKDYVREMLRADNVVYCRDYENDPRILGGMWSDNPGVGTIWAISTDKATIRDWIFVTRWLKMMIDKAFEADFHRIQAYSVPYRPKSHNWMENKRLGMTREKALEGFCKNGYDLLMFRILKGII